MFENGTFKKTIILVYGIFKNANVLYGRCVHDAGKRFAPGVHMIRTRLYVVKLENVAYEYRCAKIANERHDGGTLRVKRNSVVRDTAMGRIVKSVKSTGDMTKTMDENEIGTLEMLCEFSDNNKPS